MKENKKLKKDLVLQSFAPLFLLLCVKHAHCYWKYSDAIVKCILSKEGHTICDILQIRPLGDFIVFIISLIWIIWAIVVYFGFDGVSRTRFDSYGERIVFTDDKRDAGASFMVSFILPLLIDDINTLRGFLVFFLLLIMVIVLLIKSKMFYQNPVLTILGYSVFEFRFQNPFEDIKNKEKTYIGITKGNSITDQKIIKRKYIADDVFIIFNV